MRRNDFQFAPGLRNPVKFVHESENVRNMFDDMPANNFIKLAITEGIRKDAKVMYDVSVTARVRIDANRARYFILAATDVQYFS